MIIPWQIESPLKIPNIFPVSIDHGLFESVLIEEKIITSGFPAESSLQTQGWNIQVNELLALLWLICALIFGIYISVKYIKFCNIIKKEPLLKEKKVFALLEECKTRMKSCALLKITVTDKVKSPALFGYIRPRLLLPAGVIEKLNDTELSYIFMHELGHLKRHDIGVSWVVTFLQIFQWFNPFVWLAFHQMRIDQESACDASVLSKIKHDQTIDYAGTIIGFLENFYQNRKLPALVGILENQTQIKKRITTIVNYRKNSKPMMFFPAVFLIIIGAVFFSFNGFSKESRQQAGLDSSIMQASHFETPKGPDFLNSDYDYIIDASLFAEGDQGAPVLDQYTGIEDAAADRGLNSETQKIIQEVKGNNIKKEITQEEIRPRAQKAFATVNEEGAGHEVARDKLKQETQKALVETNIINSNNEVKTAGLANESQKEPVEGLNVSKGEYNGYTDGDIIRYLARAEYLREQPAEAAALSEKTINTDKEGNLKKTDIPGLSNNNSVNLNNTKVTGDLFENELYGEKIYSRKGVDKDPKLVSMYPPLYPDNAVLKGIEGRVLLRFILNKEGKILNPQVVRAEPQGIFEQAALDTIIKYRFQPAMKDGEYVSTAVNVPISFDISEI
jgi:TonB family protein